MPRFLLVRHGQSTWNAVGRWQGWADPPLSPTGEDQAREASANLDGTRFGAVASSDLQRARTTAEVLAEGLGLGAVAVDAGLRERDVGDWEGFTGDEIDQRWPGLRDAWRRGDVPNPPNGEQNPAIVERVLAALGRLDADHPDDDVLVVTHGGVIRILGRHLGGDAVPIPNLAGRWFDRRDGTLEPGPVVHLVPQDHETVPRSE